MPSVLAQVTIPTDSGLPADSAVNTFSFVTSDVLAPTLDIVKTRLKSFYDTLHAPGTFPILSRLSINLNPALATVKFYNRADPLPRAPVATLPLGLVGATGNDSLPSEVALCLSFRASLVSGTLPARRRGRIYIGPLAPSAGANDGNDMRPVAAFRDALRGAGLYLQGASDAQATWVVHSSFPLPAGSDATVVAGWVDNAFDIQRRRGVKANVRESF